MGDEVTRQGEVVGSSGESRKSELIVYVGECECEGVVSGWM